jgi:hypothetical protein
MTHLDRARSTRSRIRCRSSPAGRVNWRRSIGANAQALVDRESALDNVIRLRRRIQPKHTEDA